jgi:hypothetical protein
MCCCKSGEAGDGRYTLRVDYSNRISEAARSGRFEAVSELTQEVEAWLNAYAALERRIDFAQLDTNSVARYWAAKQTNAVPVSKQLPPHINKATRVGRNYWKNASRRMGLRFSHGERPNQSWCCFGNAVPRVL